jgi:ribosome-binding ATPase YchF (GTP1/OBG family)
VLAYPALLDLATPKLYPLESSESFLVDRNESAEVLAYADFLEAHGVYAGRVGASMKEARTRDPLREEGKTYVVQDGDIMHIRAST